MPTKLFCFATLAMLLLGPAAPTAGTWAADETARRAELQQFLMRVEARMAAIPVRACAPRVNLDYAAMFEADIDRSPLSDAKRIARGIMQWEDFLRYYETEVAAVCRVYDEVRRNERRLEKTRLDVRERLRRAVRTIQSRMPSSPAELEQVFPTPWCFDAIKQSLTTLELLRRTVGVFDGVIRERRPIPLLTVQCAGLFGSHRYVNYDDIDIVVAAARRHAANWCSQTVRNGALLARAFQKHAPASGDAVRLYADASAVMRGEIERIASTGAATLCTGADTSLRALIGPALHKVFEPPVDIDERLYAEAEYTLRMHGRRLRES